MGVSVRFLDGPAGGRVAHLVHVAIPLPSILWRDDESDASAVYALDAAEPDPDGTWRYRNRPTVVGHRGTPVRGGGWRRHRTRLGADPRGMVRRQVTARRVTICRYAV